MRLPRLGSVLRAGGPFKPAFGLSGAVRQLDNVLPQLVRVFGSSIPTDTHPAHSLLHNGSASNIPTLNFAKSAKFRMGHPPLSISQK
jgi:hypothetical protein